MRLNRILYACLLILAFTFLLYYGGKVPYMLFYTVLGLPMVSLLFNIMGYLGIKYEQIPDSNAVMKGDVVQLVIRITNRSFVILPYVNIQLFSNWGAFLERPNIKVLSLPPFSTRTYTLEYQCNYRGCFKIGVHKVEIQDYLGIFIFTKGNKHPIELSIHPKIIEIENFNRNSSNAPEQRLNNGYGFEDLTEIEEINPYVYGDNLNKIHWKLTAKRNELMVKKYQRTTVSNPIFLVDLNKIKNTRESNIVLEDKHIEAVVAVLKFYIENGAAVSLVYYDREIQKIECNNSVDFNHVYEALTKVKFNQNKSFHDIIVSQTITNRNKSEILLSTSTVDNELYKALCQVKSAGFDISLIYVSPQEIIDGETIQILDGLWGMGIKIYNCNINDNIKKVLESGGSINW
jgi:uncharacterized protein (DUF58 family)